MELYSPLFILQFGFKQRATFTLQLKVSLSLKFNLFSFPRSESFIKTWAASGG